jgi:hypothetical protein
MKLYTFVVHYLQMCMKEYGCCPKFKRGDHSTYTFMKRGVVYLVSAIRIIIIIIRNGAKTISLPNIGRLNYLFLSSFYIANIQM